jgi:hypothetical protein
MKTVLRTLKGLDGGRKSFPMIGKFFSNGWKKSGVFSKDWKKFSGVFQ